MSEKNISTVRKRWPLRGDVFFLGFILLSGVGGVMAIKAWTHREKLPSIVVPSLGATGDLPIAQPITFSALTDIALPPGAELVREEAVVVDSARKLQRRAALLSPDLRMQSVEILIWPRRGQPSGKTGPQAISSQIQANLAKSGYLFQQTGKEADKNTIIREFVAVSRAKKRIVPGFWMATDEFLLLAWGSFTSGNRKSGKTSAS